MYIFIKNVYDFIYPTPSTGETIANNLKNIIIRIDLSMYNLRHQCYDISFNMSADIKEHEP